MPDGRVTNAGRADPARPPLPIDHLVYGAPDLDEAVESLAVRLGVRPVRGGRHLAFGTWNALLAVGPDAYLEILSPDPGREPSVRPSIFGVDELAEPRLVGWVARARDRADMDARRRAARAAGIDMGKPLEGRRETRDGRTLRWVLTDPYMRHFDGVLPLLIDWLDTPHPARAAPAGVRLLRLTGAHPAGRAARAALDALGIDLEVARAPKPALRATLEGPVGLVELT